MVLSKLVPQLWGALQALLRCSGNEPPSVLLPSKGLPELTLQLRAKGKEEDCGVLV